MIQTNKNFMLGSRGGGGGRQVIGTPLPLVNHKAIGFLSNTGPDPLENQKATKPAFNVGPSSLRRSDDGPLLVVFGCQLKKLEPPPPPPHTHTKKNETKL